MDEWVIQQLLIMYKMKIQIEIMKLQFKHIQKFQDKQAIVVVVVELSVVLFLLYSRLSLVYSLLNKVQECLQKATTLPPLTPPTPHLHTLITLPTHPTNHQHLLMDQLINSLETILVQLNGRRDPSESE